MAVRKLTTWQEWLEADRLIDTAFLHPWDEEKASEKVQSQAKGTEPRPEQTWGLTDEDGTLLAAITTLDHQMYFGGTTVDVGEVHMVGSRVESRGGGNVRTLMKEILDDFTARGHAFAALIPFSCSFYRKFGFELASHATKQKVPMDQLAGIRCDFRATHVEREEDVATVRALYDDFAHVRTLASVRTDADWHWRGNGEFGERDWMMGDSRLHTYVLWDEDDKACAYVTFAFKHEPNMPFFGELVVTDLVYDGPEAFRGLLGLLYRLRAKAGSVTFELRDDIDLATFLPEGDDVERTAVDFAMLRILDVSHVLELMPHPPIEGSFTLEVDDDFLPQNSGIYRVQVGPEGTHVERCDAQTDLRVTIQTLTLLASGRIGLEGALFREGTHLAGNEELLSRVFTKRPLHFRL